MKIQQSTTKLTSPKKPVPQAPQPDQSTSTDSVELGNQTRELETDIGRMYSLYRTSNSQYDQKNLKREMLARLDSSTGTLPAKIQLQDLLTRLFTKNDKAWELKSQQGKPTPGTDVEFNSGKFDVAKGQPLCGDNLFNLGEWQRRKNLIPILQPQDEKRDLNFMGGSSTKRKIEEDLDLMGGRTRKGDGSVADIVREDIDRGAATPRDAMKSPADDINNDINLMGTQKPAKRLHSDFAAHLFNRLA